MFRHTINSLRMTIPLFEWIPMVLLTKMCFSVRGLLVTNVVANISIDHYFVNNEKHNANPVVAHVSLTSPHRLVVLLKLQKAAILYVGGHKVIEI